MKAQSPPSSKSLLRRGFSLVELLVVITIIIVLAAIVVPVANKMRTNAKDNQCVDQLRSWGNVIAMYAGENAGAVECRNWNSIGDTDQSAYVTYWSSTETHADGYQTLAKMRCCPSLKGKAAISGNGNSFTAYSMTDPTGSSAGKKIASYNLAQIKNGSRFVIMIEAAGGTSYIQDASGYTNRVKPLTLPANARHKNNAVNALMGDFSVRTMIWKDIEKGLTYWTAL